MPKTRTKSQRTGDQGEDFFQSYATKNLSLIPNKSARDYGIDFFCQVVKNNLPTSTFIAVNVKSTEQTRPRAKLNTDDLIMAFKATCPLLFILVDLLKEVVYYRFLDLELIEVFNELIKNDKEFILKPQIMNNSPQDFITELENIIKTEYQNKLHKRRIELGVKDIIGDAELGLFQYRDGSIALLEVPSIDSILDKSNESYMRIRENFLSKDFDADKILENASMKPFITNDLKSAASQIIVRAPLQIGQFNEIAIKKNNVIQARCVFEVRGFSDEFSLYHPSGLAITLSAARAADDGQHYHYMGVINNNPDSKPIFESPDLVNFLKNCTEDSNIDFWGHGNEGIKVEHWPELAFMGYFLQKVERVYTALKINAPLIKLFDFNNVKILNSISFMDYLLKPHKEKSKGIIGITTVDNDKENEIQWKPGKIFLPIGLILPEGHIIVSISFMGDIGYLDNVDKNPIAFMLKHHDEIYPYTIVDSEESFDNPAIIISPDEIYEMIYDANGFSLSKRQTQIDAEIYYRFL